MKIVTGMLFVVLLFLGFFFLQKKTAEPELAYFLPADTLGYVEQKNGLEALLQFKQTRLGKTLTSTDYAGIMRELALPAEQISELEDGLADLAEFQNNKLAQELLGRHFALGLLPERSWAEASATGLKLKQQLLLICKPQHSAAALDLLTTYYKGDSQLSPIAYGKHTIKRFKDGDTTLAVAVVDGYVVGSFEERSLREGLDAFDQKDSSLANSADFKRIDTALDGAERLVYISMEGLQSFAKKELAKLQVDSKEDLSTDLSRLSGMKALGYGSWRKQAILEDKWMVLTNKDKMDANYKQLLAIAPGKNETLDFASEDMLLYGWSNTTDLSTFWKMYFAENKTNSPEITAIRQTVRDATAMEVEDILALFDSGVSAFVKESEASRPFPIPDFAVLIKLKKPDEVQKLLPQVFARLGIPIQEDSYNKVTYHSYSQYASTGMQPLYAIHRDYLLITTSVEVLKGVVDGPKKELALPTAANFKEIDPGFAGNNNSVVYVNQARLMEKLKELVGWGGTFAAIQGPEVALKVSVITEKLVNPLLHGLAMYDKIATRSYVEGDLLIQESKTRIVQ